MQNSDFDLYPVEFHDEIRSVLAEIAAFDDAVDLENRSWHYIVEDGGDLFSSRSNLTSLEGCPQIVKGDFGCDNNKLTSLTAGPRLVNGNYFCYNNQLTTLMSAPKFIFGFFDCEKNVLTTLEGCPIFVNGPFQCAGNNLTSLYGAPAEVGSFYCENNKLTDLNYIPIRIHHNCNISANHIMSLKDIHHHFKDGFIGGTLTIGTIYSHILGVLLIPQLTRVRYTKDISTIDWADTKKCEQAVAIVNKHLAGNRSVIDCQRELIRAGLKEFAKL